jgi:hypothetical protein
VRRGLLLALAALALALATGLALLARDVGRWEDRLAEDDGQFQVTPGRRGLWRVETTLPAGTARSLLDLDDDLAFRRAVRLFRLGRPRDDATGHSEWTTLQNESRSQLARVLELDADPPRRSRAENLLGALDFAEGLRNPAGGAALLGRGAAHFARAIELDPADENAKVNLELVLRRQGQRPRSPAAGRGDGSAQRGRGAGQSSSGSGY